MPAFMNTCCLYMRLYKTPPKTHVKDCVTCLRVLNTILNYVVLFGHVH